MAQYSVATAKDSLSSLIAKAQAGEEVIITSRGKPVAELCSARPAPVDGARSTEWLLSRTRARKGIGLTSVELLDMMYDQDET